MKKITTVLFLVVSFVFPSFVFASGVLSVTGVSNTYSYPMINFIISARVAPDTQIVFWNSNQPVKSSLWLSKEDTLTNSNSVKYTDGQINENHFVVLKGLQANTRYYYVVGVRDDINQAFSETKSFSISDK